MSFSVSFMGGQLPLVSDIRKIAKKHIGIGNELLKTFIVQVDLGTSVFPVHREQEVRIWYPPSQWKSLRTTNAIARPHEEFKRRIKTQCALAPAGLAHTTFP